MSASKPHHAADGTFRNHGHDSRPRDWRDVRRWARERRRQERDPTPPRGSFPRAIPDIVHPKNGAGMHAATWIGHSTILLQMDGLNIITDPVFSERAFPVQWMGPRRVMDPAISLDALPPLDIILLSHNHYDHLDKPAVKRIARAHPDATLVTPLRLGAYLRRWRPREIMELDWWDEIEVGKARVTATPARHFSARGLLDRNRSLWS